ncbi:MAG TPA: hypothetical protein VFG59_21800 [Anaeromyxobacter sp.]|nr:hypothetical protein [Anaeromyxobacter sp.]
MVREQVGRCRRCGTDLARAVGQPFAHHLFLRSDEGGSEVTLSLCLPCGADFATIRDRDEYVRLGYLG